MHTTSTELVGKLVKFCTNLHMLIFLAFKKKDPFTPNLTRHTVILTCSKNTATPNTQHTTQNSMSNATFAAAAADATNYTPVP